MALSDDIIKALSRYPRQGKFVRPSTQKDKDFVDRVRRGQVTSAPNEMVHQGRSPFNTTVSPSAASSAPIYQGRSPFNLDPGSSPSYQGNSTFSLNPSTPAVPPPRPAGNYSGNTLGHGQTQTPWGTARDPAIPQVNNPFREPPPGTPSPTPQIAPTVGPRGPLATPPVAPAGAPSPAPAAPAAPPKSLLSTGPDDPMAAIRAALAAHGTPSGVAAGGGVRAGLRSPPGGPPRPPMPPSPPGGSPAGSNPQDYLALRAAALPAIGLEAAALGQGRQPSPQPSPMADKEDEPPSGSGSRGVSGRPTPGNVGNPPEAESENLPPKAMPPAPKDMPPPGRIAPPEPPNYPARAVPSTPPVRAGGPRLRIYPPERTDSLPSRATPPVPLPRSRPVPMPQARPAAPLPQNRPASASGMAAPVRPPMGAQQPSASDIQNVLKALFSGGATDRRGQRFQPVIEAGNPYKY